MVGYSREIFLWYGVVCFLLLGTGYFLQYVFGVMPCPLCILQRFFFILTGLLAFGTWYRYGQWMHRIIGAVLVGISSLLGFLVAIRLVWIQQFPPLTGSVTCLPPWLHTMTDIAHALRGTADCADRSFTIFFLPIATWSLIAFFGLLLVSIAQGVFAFRRGEE